MNTTKRIEEAVKALDEEKVKRALYLTDNEKTQRHHGIVAEAARKCLTDKTNCGSFLHDAAAKLKDTITPPLDGTDLEGVEEMLQGQETQPSPNQEQTDEEVYENCEECHVSDAVVKFHQVAEHCGDAETLTTLDQTLENDMTLPEEWVKKMITIAEQPTCGQESYKGILTELSEYLGNRDSPILKKLETEKAEEDGGIDKEP